MNNLIQSLYKRITPALTWLTKRAKSHLLKLSNRIRAWNKRSHLFFILMALLSILAVDYTFHAQAIIYSGFAAAFAKIIGGMLTLFLFERLILNEIHTRDAFTTNNIAYSLYVLAFALIVCAGIIGS